MTDDDIRGLIKELEAELETLKDQAGLVAWQRRQKLKRALESLRWALSVLEE